MEITRLEHDRQFLSENSFKVMDSLRCQWVLFITTANISELNRWSVQDHRARFMVNHADMAHRLITFHESKQVPASISVSFRFGYWSKCHHDLREKGWLSPSCLALPKRTSLLSPNPFNSFIAKVEHHQTAEQFLACSNNASLFVEIELIYLLDGIESTRGVCSSF